jgi:hypothetical protein
MVMAAGAPLGAWSQAGRSSPTPNPANPSAGGSSANRTQTHDRNWFKKQAEKRYNGTLTTPKKTEKAAKVEDKPAEKKLALR